MCLRSGIAKSESNLVAHRERLVDKNLTNVIIPELIARHHRWDRLARLRFLEIIIVMPAFKTLLVMRHAKSSWKTLGISDHERPLNRRGERDAVEMAKFLKSAQIDIGRIAASTARRADQTAKALIKTIDGLKPDQLESRDDFYLAAPRAYLDYLKALDDSVSTVILIGHNPGLESLVEFLGGRWETMTTAAIACFDCSASSWSDADPSEFRLDHMWRPKDILEHYR